MSAEDQDLFGTMLRIENKDLFIDLRKNTNGVYLKISERNGKSRNTILVPASGLVRLKAVLEEVIPLTNLHSKNRELRKSRSSDSPKGSTRSIYVSGLSWSTTSDELRQHFQQAGSVVNSAVLYKTRAGKVLSMGCGTVEFTSPEEAAHAVTMLNNSVLDGRTIKCREDRKSLDFPHSSSESTHSAMAPDGAGASGERTLEPCKVFVTSLPWDVKSEVLVGLFSSVGEVTGVELLTTKKGRSLGHAVVEFSSPVSASAAIAQLNGSGVGGRAIIVREYYL